MIPRHLVVGTAGHIDHGKSALVRALTGVDPDRLKEEKRRGITIDLGFADLEVSPGRVLSFVDVPGHERFVRHMVAGASGIDAVLMVVASDDGVRPQTREHLHIASLLGLRHGVVALTKTDLVDGEVLEVVQLELREFLSATFLENAPVLSVSSRTGEGLLALRAVLEELIDRVPPRPAGGVARLPIDRSFVLPGFGTVVTGTLASGALRAGDEVEVLPAGRRGRIRGLQTHRRRVDEARAGQRTAVNLQGLDRAQAPRGAVVTHPGSLWTTRRIRASARFLPGVLEGLGRGGPVRFHQGTSERAARLKVLHGSGTQREIEIAFKAETVLLPGDRFILRRPAPLDTLGGGIVLDIRPPRGRARSPEVPEDQALGVYAPVLLRVAREGSAGKSMSDLALELGWTAAERDGRLEEMTSRGVLVRAGERVFDPGTWRGLEQSLRDALGDYHAREPLRTGMSREELRVAVRRDLAQDVWRALLEESAARGELRLEADRVALATHRVVLSAADRDAGERIEQRFRDAGLDPPDLEDVLGIESAQRGARLIEVLVSQGRLVRIRDGRLFHAAALVRLRERLKEHARTSRTIDVAGFKELFGVTRRNAIPLLEQLDAERSTRRVGNVREILIA